MKQEKLIEQIKKQAKRDALNRKDPRFTDTLGFLVAKGFLTTNLEVPMRHNIRLQVEDVLWAGKNVEPRILEVLPAAYLRLEKHFQVDADIHAPLLHIVNMLRKNADFGVPFFDIPYEKIKVWVNYRLKDGRVKTLAEKKVTKTFRLKPKAIFRLKKLAKQFDCSEAEVLERKLLE